jgi:hypothetical protein
MNRCRLRLPQFSHQVTFYTEMAFFEQLMRRTEGFQSSRYGVTLEDFLKIPVSIEFGDEIIAALRSSDPKDRRTALFFCEGFVRNNKAEMLGERFLDRLVADVVKLIHDEDALVRDAGIPVFVLLRTHFGNYRISMLRALVDTSPTVRGTALNSANTFLGSGEIDPLLSFERDVYRSESTPGGAIHYLLRNQALTIIENMLRRQFAKHELTEIVEGEVVFWWDWRPLLDWCDGRRSRGG